MISDKHLIEVLFLFVTVLEIKPLGTLMIDWWSLSLLVVLGGGRWLTLEHADY